MLPFACGGGEDESETSSDTSTEPDCDAAAGEICGSITADAVWDADVVLVGIVSVEDGATLTVNAGVTVRGKSGSALVIKQGGRIEAVGTADAPIVFTSSQEEGKRQRGDWGGLVLLGSAPTNLPGGSGVAEGLAGDFNYGGSDAAYNCGTLKYVRVEFAGYELTTDNELNGITAYACGTATTFEWVQVAMGKDDGIEMFGGSFNGKYIVVTGAVDDSIDIDQGWSGTLQHIFIQHDPTVGNYSFEISNQGDNVDATPRTTPHIANVTAIGSGQTNDTKSAGIKLKEGAAGEIYNSIFVNHYKGSVDLTESATETQASSGAIKLANNIFYQNNGSGDGDYITDDGSTFDLQGFVEDAANNNTVGADPLLGSLTWGAPNVTPSAGSPALTAPASPPSGFEATDYIGAVKDSDWTQAAWISYADR
ncbi:MAG: hypothetical protein R3A51_08500 [Nannocystaceae bacterium]